MKILKVKPGKSGTREVAISLLLLWSFMTGYVFLWIPHEQVVDYKEVYSSLTTACVGFAMGAFISHLYLQNRNFQGSEEGAIGTS